MGNRRYVALSSSVSILSIAYLTAARSFPNTMSSTEHFPTLYQVPVLHSRPTAPTAAYTLLHFVTQDCFEAVRTLHLRFQEENETIRGKLEVVHVYSGANPYAFGVWAKEIGPECTVAWVGPDFTSNSKFLGQKIGIFPFFLVLEGKRLIHADSHLTFPLAEMPQKCISRNLRELALSAISLKPRDASSAVICSLVLRDLVTFLPLPKPRDLVAEQQRQIEQLKEEVQQKEREIEALRLNRYL